MCTPGVSYYKVIQKRKTTFSFLCFAEAGAKKFLFDTFRVQFLKLRKQMIFRFHVIRSDLLVFIIFIMVIF